MPTKFRRLLASPTLIPPSVVALAFLSACGAPEESTPDLESVSAALKAAPACEKKPARVLSAKFLGRYATGLEGLESSGETAALDGDRLFVTSAQAAALDIVDVDDPTEPELITRVDLTGYGPQIQSVAVSSKGLVAVAVQGVLKTDPGKVVLLDKKGTTLRTVTVGALPDMLTFTKDGAQLIVANEGEPDCYGEGCTDPLGSVSIVDVHPLKRTPKVKTIDFSGVELPPGVRVFGPGATPAQDLEPEYVALSDDGETAYVTLQENNALAVIDLERARVEEIRALGYKDFSSAPTTTTYEIGKLPAIGSTAAGQEIKLGGFSGLFFEGFTSKGKLKFVTHTDRGPNAEPIGSLRPFLLPEFTPRIVRLELDPNTAKVSITEQIKLRKSDRSPLTGLSNTSVLGGDANSAHNDEVPVDVFGNVLPLDPLGGDVEGIVVAADGSFWMGDEYRPALYHFDARGVLLERLVPVGSHTAAGLPVPAAGTAGELGIEALPSVLGQRRQNRGFEGLAFQTGKLYAIVQSPLRNPVTLSNGALNAMQNVRLVEVDPTTFATRQFIYVMDNVASVSADDTRADKIGDLTALPGSGFLILERDDDALPEDPASTIAKKIYAFNLNNATDITSKDTLYSGKSLDQMTSSELAAVGVRPLSKVLHIDLVEAGYAAYEKVEGLALIDATTVAVINDNDFRVAGVVIDQATGTFTYPPSYVPEPEVLGLIATSGIDASDRDSLINIRDWPVSGMYQPDAIASFEACGRTRFLVTANEGDARDYDGFAEEARARSQSAAYPAIPEVLNDLELGRLTITTAPPGGDLSRPYVFGTRSFSIWNAETGAQVWDSGADFESITAGAFPLNFNSTHDANDFDSRSDNKGVEPEGIAVGEIEDRTYAFVGLERVGGVIIYDITVPTAPVFIEYLNTRSFAGPSVGPDSGAEIVTFVDKSESPTRKPLLVASNEITGTVVFWQLDSKRLPKH